MSYYYGGYAYPPPPPQDPKVTQLQSFINYIRLYKNPTIVKDHCQSVFLSFPNLSPNYQQTDRGNLVILKGTIPILFQNVTYNIPVKIFLPYLFPAEAPSVVLDPTPEMFVVSNHHKVNSYGVCLFSWDSSTFLNKVIMNLCDEFSAVPPLQTRGAQQAPPVQRAIPTPPIATGSNTPPLNQTPNNNSPPPYAGGSWGQPPPSYNESVIKKAAAVVTNSPPPPPKPLPSLPVVDEREELVKKVTLRLQEMLSKYYEDGSHKLKDYNAAVLGAEEHASKLSSELANLEKDLEYTNKAISDISVECDSLTEKLKELETAESNAQQVNVESLLGPKDNLSRQIMRLSSEILAIEDTLQSLDSALRSDKISLEEYLKNVRSLSRDQFIAKATLKKAQDLFKKTRLQAQQQVVNGGSPLGGSGYALSPPSPTTSSSHLHQTQLSQLY